MDPHWLRKTSRRSTPLTIVAPITFRKILTRHNEYCSEYLNKYPNDDKRLTEFAGNFVSAYKKISQYIKSVSMTDYEEITPSWAVYSPGLLATISSEDSRDPKYPDDSEWRDSRNVS